jgi:hypothetical protein
VDHLHLRIGLKRHSSVKMVSVGDDFLLLQKTRTRARLSIVPNLTVESVSPWHRDFPRGLTLFIHASLAFAHSL